jgi:hypothetical protein
MRELPILFIVVLVIGLWITIRQPSYAREESAVQLTDLEATMQEQRSVPGWTRAIALGAGVVLVLVWRKRS